MTNQIKKTLTSAMIKQKSPIVKSLNPIQETYQSSDPAYQNPTISHIEYLFNAKDIVVGVVMNLTNTPSEEIVNCFTFSKR